MIWVDEHAKAMVNPRGEISVLVVCQDITDRKQAEEALTRSEKKYRNIIENIQDVVYRTDRDGKLIMFSPSGVKLAGYNSEEEMIGLDVALDTYQNPGEREHFLAALNEKGSVENFPLVLKTRTGNPRIVLASSHFYYDDAGSVLGVEGILHDITELRKTEQNLRASEEMFRTLVEYTLDGILILDPGGKILFANQAAGKTIEADHYRELFGTANVLEFIAPESKEAAVRDFGQVAAGVDGYLAHYKVITIRHRERWVESIGKAIIFNGAPAILISLRDITDRRQAEAVVRESERKFRTIFENSPYPIAINGIPDGKFVEVNPAFLKASGYTETEILGKTPMEMGLISLLDFGRLSSHLILTGKLENVPMALKGKGGNAIHVLFSVIPVTLNERPAILTVTAEITKLKRVEAELLQKNEELTATEEELRANYDELRHQEETLRASEEKFRTLVEHSLDGILILDMNGKILFRNRAAANLVDQEITPDHLTTKNVMEFVAPESQASVLHDLGQVARGTDGYPVNYQAVTASGRHIWIEGIGKRILFRNSPAILVSLRDISSRKQMEEALIRTNKQLNLLSSITRHDILNKIAAIQGFIAFARRKGQQQDYPALLDRIDDATKTIKSQLEFTRVYQTLGTREPAWQKPGTFLSSSQLPDSVHLTSELGNLEIYADLMLANVFRNLADNSVRHGGNVTEIRLESFPDTDGLTITFEDNGVGIPMEEKEMIFQRGHGKNTGLGLFLAREILGITGITIRETGEPGKGARFEIRVPENAYRLPSGT
jgi:PAS domain S-box-containing protein